MKIAVKWDDASLLLRLRNGEKRLAYATANALRDTALKVQQDEFTNVRGSFHIRRPEFFFGGTTSGPGGNVGGAAARITKFPNPKVGRLYAEVTAGLGASVGRRAVILPRFETGGVRTARTGAVLIPITGGARPTMSSEIAPQYKFGALKLTAYRGGRKVRRRGRRRRAERGFDDYGSTVPTHIGSFGGQVKGENRSFLIHSDRYPKGAVFVRTGRGRAAIKMIWKLQSGVPLDARLHYTSTAQASWRRYYREFFTQQVIATLTYNRFNFVR